MKAMKCILLFVACVAMAACGGENLEAYKEQVLEYGAKKMGTTKELLVKDCDVIVDSMSIIPITVQDSINIINNLDSYKESLETELARFEQLKKNRFYFWKMRDTERVQEIEDEFALIEKTKARLPEYEAMNKDKVLIKVFRCWMAIKIPLLGRKTGIDYSLFSLDGKFLDSADSKMIKYIEAKGLK